MFFKRKGIIAWNKLNDRFGSPTPWGRYPRNAGPKEKGTLFDALRAISNDGVVMTPEGMQIELLDLRIQRAGAVPGVPRDRRRGRPEGEQ
ncbi:MAG: DUF935 domain-containing protein [Thauera sp.]|nr:DUF935 domain-containing protein [Thauera sp.]